MFCKEIKKNNMVIQLVKLGELDEIEYVSQILWKE